MIYFNLFSAEDILITKRMNYSRESKYNMTNIKEKYYFWNKECY